jgi:hypothetical protein
VQIVRLTLCVFTGGFGFPLVPSSVRLQCGVEAHHLLPMTWSFFSYERTGIFLAFPKSFEYRPCPFRRRNVASADAAATSKL